jgi:hypothetical protein
MRVGFDISRSIKHQTLLALTSKLSPRVISVNLSQLMRVGSPTQVVAVISSPANDCFL